MSVESSQYAEAATNAATVPLKMTTALAGLDGHGQGGLTLTREHIITLKIYFAFAMALPTTEAAAVQWLNYEHIDKPALMPASMAELFSEVRNHALGWTPLSDDCKNLAHLLSTTAQEINSASEILLKSAEAFRKIHGFQAAWRDIVIDKPIPLGTEDKDVLKGISEVLVAMKKIALEYSIKVQRVIDKTGVFRDVLEQQLIPKTQNKLLAIEQYKSDGKTAEVKALIAERDVEIKELQAQYNNLVKESLSGLKYAIVGVAFTAGIFAPQAETARKARNAAQDERRQLSKQLVELKRIDGAVEELATNVGVLVDRLNDAGAAARHLKTSWSFVEVYIQQSIENIDKIQDTKALLQFLIYFTNFSKQWLSIETLSTQLTSIFDEALNLKESSHVQ